MSGPKTNEREGTRAVLRHARVSAYKVREVLDIIRNKPVAEAADILRFTERDAGLLVGKLLQSAIANASHNDQQDPEELFVSACFADEGTTIKRWRPRARGRATRIRKRTCHITVIVSRMPDAALVRLQASREAEQTARRSRRVAGARKADATPTASGTAGRGIRSRVRPARRQDTGPGHDHDHDHEEQADQVTKVTAALGTPKATPAAPAPAPPAPATEAAADETEKGE